MDCVNVTKVVFGLDGITCFKNNIDLPMVFCLPHVRLGNRECYSLL